MATIPKIIHYCWIGSAEKPQSVQYCIDSWKKYCPDYEIIEWNENNYDFTKNQYMREAYEAKKWGFVPDYARLDIIYNHGGIYLDTDVEIIKNFDDLLEKKAFIGFENTGTEELFVNCGQGFGSISKNPLIKEMRDFYDNMHFCEKDGTLNMLPSPHFTTKVLCDKGLVRNDITQNLDNIVVYNSEVLCPKNFTTGDINITKDTYSIHHFTASWLDEKIKKVMCHQRNIYKKYGNRLGGYILIMESIFEKYNFIELFSKLPKNILKKFVSLLHEKLIIAFDYLYLYKAIIKKHFNNKNKSNKEILIFDTFMNSQNSGDQIIMDNCIHFLKNLNIGKEFKHVPTHTYPKDEELNLLNNIDKKIVCGTNILSGNMKSYGVWKLPENIDSYNEIILMGVGFASKNNKFTPYTNKLLKYMLSKDAVHSVRDSFTEKCLKDIGIKNVVNTSCPTMWILDETLCSKIPLIKSRDVVCTITDYSRDKENDSAMLDILLDNYDKVSIWIQGEDDYEYLSELGYIHKLNIIPIGLENYDKFLEKNNSLDYIGTRLHAGIRAMSYRHRSIIISIDNRAEAISNDTGLPIIYRAHVKNKLEKKIKSSFETKVNLPKENIRLWISQF